MQINNDINILVVEDDDDINNLLTDMLTSNGYNVKSAYSGTEALVYLRYEKISLILLDLMLPGKDGETVLKEIREVQKIPVIIISAKEESGIKARLLRNGADDFISKPFDLDEVLARIEVNIRRSIELNNSSSCNNLLIYKEICLNNINREVTVNNIIINLTVREFQILELLLKHPTKVFSKDNIFKSVWKDVYINDENTITVHISNLRNKISKAGAKNSYIKTVWGIGYRLEAK